MEYTMEAIISQHRPEFVRCIKEPTIVSHLEPTILSPDEAKRLRAECQQHNTPQWVEHLLDQVLESQEPGKLRTFQEALKKAGYPYLLRLLNQEPVEQDDDYVGRISIVRPELEKALSTEIPDLIVNLESNKVINMVDRQEVESHRKNKGDLHGIGLLLDRMQCRLSPKQWYYSFCKVLLEIKREHLLEELDPDFLANPSGFWPVKGQDGYTITGRKEAVGNAVKEILQVFIVYGCKPERAVQEKEQHRQHAQRETLEYVRFMVGEEPEVPRYWKNFKPGEPLKTTFTDYKLYGGKWAKVRLDPSDPIYKSIQQLINNTWDSSKLGKGLDAKGLQRLSYTRMKVTQIDRIENLDLYHEYTQKRVKVFTGLLQRGLARFPEIHQLPGCTGKVQSAYYADKCLLKDMNTEINEFYFFHGTKPQNVSVICHQGLDNRLASGSAMFGQGIYGAETPTEADQYADDQDNRTGGHGQPKQMFLLRIILGNAFVCKEHNPHKFKRPPCVTCKRDDCRNQQHRGLFDSVVGDNKKLFREFVVYDKGLCYPEYLITYERL